MSVEGDLYNSSDFERVATTTKQEKEKYRSSFRRDFARLIHCPSFRRLQGKTQVFPGHESDFFRNRLTHSLEVAQIAKSIANKLNDESEYFSAANQKINTDLVEFAGLAHDLGHPPFGHNGEEALDECMLDDGGFEGNAQTLRIIARVEKKETLRLVEGEIVPVDGSVDIRCGLNLSFRSLASVLKYNVMIPERLSDRTPGKVKKGYYSDEAELVAAIKKHVLNHQHCDDTEFKTIECSIMDVADDIAYSTYDLEDAFKAFFATPMFLIVNDTVFEAVAQTIQTRIDASFKEISSEERKFSTEDVTTILYEIFSELFSVDDQDKLFIDNPQITPEEKRRWLAIQTTGISRRMTIDGYERTKKTSQLVQEFIGGIEVRPHKNFVQLHQVRLKLQTFKKVEVLKNLIFETIIKSPSMRFVEYRGKDIVQKIFAAVEANGENLLPDDYRHLYKSLTGSARKRIVCDFIAGMTDRYAIEFYSRLFGTNPQTIHKPV